MTSHLKHDALIKKILTDQLAAQEFLEHYLPADFKALVDLSQITIEKESFVEDDLKRKLTDLLYSVKTKNQEKAFVYVLIEAQVTSDHWMALRLWKYMLLLCERNRKNKDKLPLICPIVIYHGSKPYHAPRNVWQLFSNPEQAQKLMGEEYQLIDLQSMSDDAILQKKHLAMFEYLLKHIHKRDILKLWENLFTHCQHALLVDKEKGYICIKALVWYSDAKLPEEKQAELERVISSHLSKEETATIMRTIAQKYIEEGRQQGIEKGMEKGKMERNLEIAKAMLANGVEVSFIAQITGLDTACIASLQLLDRNL
ncbi:Rpn family recombination-promoting nuclease/putative transposase [Candidatus Cardinium hertigii]|uniref:Recombination-promoting nuclease RpnD n=1 Tax=Candidatus Cardinium hertigii TaxID=247481 RepID=A0A2Z3L8I9_9BACT|nr:Rpn family recombination-promoting nuclease/putative transposase [Candidatus Cardinium hertigii]AWN81903.1 Recombination-promoting nuclease RpnD [Candidatus Cardinium hertigii]